jgi:hypothetical protein
VFAGVGTPSTTAILYADIGTSSFILYHNALKEKASTGTALPFLTEYPLVLFFLLTLVFFCVVQALCSMF